MTGFQGADVDGLDRTAQSMLDAAEAATAVATALQALVVALEAMSWTGFAAALAAYLKGVVIPWVKATAAALRAFGQVLQLASSTQRDTSGDRPVVTTGSGNYQTPQLPTASAGDGPRIATIEIHITNGQTGQGSGVQVTTPGLPGQITGTPIQSGGTGASVPATPVIATPSGSGLSTGATGGSAGSATPPAAPTPVQVGSGGVGSSGGGSGGAATGAGGSTSGWGGSLGVSSRPDGGIDVQGSFHGTIGGDPTSTSTPTTPVSGHSSLGGPVSAGATPNGTSGGINSALLAAPLGLAGLGAAALGGRGAAGTGSGTGTGTGSPSPIGSGSGLDSSGGTTPPGTTPSTPGTPGTPGTGGPADEAGWRMLATSDGAGHVNLSLVPDTDTVPTVPSALDAGSSAGQQPRIVGWFDGDGDYGFVADDLVFSTPAGQVTIDSLTLQGNVGDDPAVATAVRGWWAQALTEGATATPAIATPAIATPAIATTATATPTMPAPTPAALAAAH